MAARARQARHRSDDAVDRRRSRLTERATAVGWAERSEAHRGGGTMMGFAALSPSYSYGATKLPPPILAQDRKQQVILPLSIDQQIVAGIALLLKTGVQQQRAARHIGRQTGRFDAVQAQPFEGEIENQRQGRAHVALARIGLAGPITEARGFRDPAPDV